MKLRFDYGGNLAQAGRSMKLLPPPLHHKLHRFFTSNAVSLPTPTQPKPEGLLQKSLISIIKSSSSQTHLYQLHAFFITTNLIADANIFLHFLTRFSLSPFHDLAYSRTLLRLFPRPNVSLYHVLIRAHTFTKESSSTGFRLFREMLGSGISPNAEVASLGIKCCAKMGSFVSAAQIHGCVMKHGHNSETHLLTNLMQFYSSIGMMDEATKVFDQMPRIDTLVYNVLINCYTANGREWDALTVFDLMKTSKGCEPNNVTCLLILKSCAKLGALEHGEKVHAYVKEHGFCDDLNVCNALITMYSSCWMIKKAKEVFEGMVQRDAVTWTAMVSGFANCGCEIDAIEAFRQMVREGFVPVEKTFTVVISACSKIGMVDEGQQFFDMMSNKYNIEPNIYHYGSMVDLMSRSGLIQEAYEFIMSMKLKPDVVLWRTLLGACSKRGDDVMGEVVVRHLTELKAQESGDHVLLMNMHLLAGDFKKAEEVKELMEKQTKFPSACSTIEFEGKIHVFNADDSTHPRKDRIHNKLIEINEQLKIAGYVDEVTPEFNGKIREVKCESVSYHSEKMAIAFGILSTPPLTKLKIAKYLLVCDDCHNFAKMVSTVYDREVIITDSAHRHHFKQGRCSCNK